MFATGLLPPATSSFQQDLHCIRNPSPQVDLPSEHPKHIQLVSSIIDILTQSHPDMA